MNSQKEIDDFLNSPSFAVVGVSRSGGKFGKALLTELRKTGKKAYGINDKVTSKTGDDIFPDFQSMPDKVDAAVICIKPSYSLNAVKEAHKNGVKRIWLQQGAQSPEAVQYCLDNGIPVINNMCLLMFAESDRFPHNFHKWILKVFGKLPS